MDLDAAVRLHNEGMTLRDVAKRMKVGTSTVAPAASRVCSENGLPESGVQVLESTLLGSCAEEDRF